MAKKTIERAEFLLSSVRKSIVYALNQLIVIGRPADRVMPRSRPLTYDGKVNLQQPLPLASFISHPTEPGRLIAITSAALLEITQDGKCNVISLSGFSPASLCVFNDMTHQHGSFGQLTQIYQPDIRLREEMRIGRDEVLLVDKLKHCIHKYRLPDRVLQSFIGDCGNGGLILAYKERQLDDLILHSPVSVANLIVQSVGHLMIESEQSNLYIVSIQSSLAYRQLALSYDNKIIGSGHILHASESQLLSLLVPPVDSDNKMECYVRQSNETSTSLEDAGCDLSTRNLGEGKLIALTGSQLYKYDPHGHGSFTAGLKRVDLVVDSVTHISRGINSQLIAYSETEQQFLILDGGDEAEVGQKKATFIWHSRPLSTYSTTDIMSTRHTSAESCAYASIKSITSVGFKYSSATCMLIKDVEKGETTLVSSPTDNSDVYFSRPVIEK